jgi:hypothetical protein
MVLSETKIASGMKNVEVHTLFLGRMMNISAIVDCLWLAPTESNNASIEKKVMTVVEELKNIY